MLKRLSNRSEVFVHTILVPAATRHDAEGYRKVRIADVIDIDGLASRTLGRLSLMGHFDFVVADRNHDPQFAIEFDGGGHDSTSDSLKDEICRQSGLALFRLNPSSSRVKIKRAFFVAYLVDVWFYGQEFARMQASGEIASDEPFMMSGFLKPDARTVFDSEFDYTFSALDRLTRIVRDNDNLERPKVASLSLVGPEGQYAAFARHGDLYGRYRIAFRTVNWGKRDAFSAQRELSEFCHALAYHDLCEEIEIVRVSPYMARPIAEATKEISDLKCAGFNLVLGLGLGMPTEW